MSCPQGTLRGSQDCATASKISVMTVTGIGCTSTAGRLLPQSGGLVSPKCAGSGPWHLRLLVVGLHQQGHQTV